MEGEIEGVKIPESIEEVERKIDSLINEGTANIDEHNSQEKVMGHLLSMDFSLLL